MRRHTVTPEQANCLSEITAQIKEDPALAYDLMEKLLKKARDPKHPLHNAFTWNDRTAAEKYRVQNLPELGSEA